MLLTLKLEFTRLKQNIDGSHFSAITGGLQRYKPAYADGLFAVLGNIHTTAGCRSDPLSAVHGLR